MDGRFLVVDVKAHFSIWQVMTKKYLILGDKALFGSHSILLEYKYIDEYGFYLLRFSHSGKVIESVIIKLIIFNISLRSTFNYVLIIKYSTATQTDSTINSQSTKHHKNGDKVH